MRRTIDGPPRKIPHGREGIRIPGGAMSVVSRRRPREVLPHALGILVRSVLLLLLLTPGYAQAPAAPTGLTVTGADDTEISLSWTAPPGEVDAFNVFRCEERGQSCTPEWYAWLQGGDTTTFTDDGTADPDNDGTPAGLTPGATYRYAVLAIVYEEITTGPWPEHQGAWSNQVTAVAEAQAPTGSGP